MAGHSTWQQIQRRRLNNPEVQAGYDAARRAFELGEQVRDLRESRGMTQAELARRIGSTQPAIARLEAGGVEPKFDTLDRVGKALGMVLTVEFREPAAASA